MIQKDIGFFRENLKAKQSWSKNVEHRDIDIQIRLFLLKLNPVERRNKDTFFFFFEMTILLDVQSWNSCLSDTISWENPRNFFKQESKATSRKTMTQVWNMQHIREIKGAPEKRDRLLPWWQLNRRRKPMCRQRTGTSRRMGQGWKSGGNG